MEDHHVSEDRVFFLEKQEITANDFDTPGYILDIGGGGEGVIGRLKGEQVIAIDPNRRELEGAAAGPLKIIMDARDLQFLDATFSVATSFFTLMYVKGTDHEKVFREVFRVLKSGGRFLIWDVALPQCLDQDKDGVAFYVTVKLPHAEIDTGYGYYWPEEEQNLPYYRQLAANAGFQIVAQREEEQLFFLELRKPRLWRKNPV